MARRVNEAVDAAKGAAGRAADAARGVADEAKDAARGVAGAAEDVVGEVGKTAREVTKTATTARKMLPWVVGALVFIATGLLILLGVGVFGILGRACDIVQGWTSG